MSKVRKSLVNRCRARSTSACQRWPQLEVYGLGRLAVGGAPAPHFAALAALQHAGAEDVGDHVAVAAQQRLGGAHFRAGRQLAFGQPVAAVFVELGLASRSASGPPAQNVHLSILPRRPKVPLDGNCGAPNGQAYEQ